MLHKTRTYFSLFTLVTALTAAMASAAAGQSKSHDAYAKKLWTYLHESRVPYAQWTVAAEPVSLKFGPQVSGATLYLNSVAAKDPRSLGHGSMIVAEQRNAKDKQRVAVTVWYRVEAGFHAATDDWYWVQYADDGTVVASLAQGQPTGGPEDYDAILKKYVKGDYFDYAALKTNARDTARFEAFLRWQAEADVSKMSHEEAIAFYINAYNSCCIKAILDNYPVHSPNDVDGFFDKLKFKVAGEELTIGGDKGISIEYDRLIANYKDMRAHFAVVCADRGCLPLKGGAYVADTLDGDLEAAAKKFVRDERHFKVERKKGELPVVHISKIFEWYGPKFLKDPKRKVDGDKPELYLIPWVDKDTRQLLESGKYKLKIIEWDWTLNEKHN